MKYVMKNKETGEVVLTGKSTHCFLDEEKRPMILRRKYPDFAQKLSELSSNN